MKSWLFVLASLGCACAPPDHVVLGGFNVSWSAKTAALQVKASDGRELLASSGSVLDTRTTTATWEELYGSFRVSEGAEGWNSATGLTVKAADSKHVLFDVAQSGGHHGAMELTSPTSGVLQIKLGSDGQNRVRANFACAASDHFLGFGSQADAIDHRGHMVPIWTSEPGIGKSSEDDANNIEEWFLTGTRHAASYPLPTFISNRGLAFLADTTRRIVFDLCKADPNVWSVDTWDSAVTLKIFDGPDPAGALGKLTADIGRQPLAKDLALAPWNDAVFGSANVRAVAAKLRAAHIPSGALWTEDFRGGSFPGGDNYRLKEEWDVDRTLYPDIEQVASDLHDLGFRFFAYHNTFLTDGTQILSDARNAGVVIHHEDGSEYDYQNASFTGSTMVDLSNPAGVLFVKGWLQKLAGYGFDGWMADYAEWLPADAKLTDGSNAEAVHNEYPRQYHQLSSDVVAAMPGDAETHLYFARSGTLRTAPLQPVVWGGDQSMNFDPGDGLPSAVVLGLNFGLGGISTYGSDVAGYQNAVDPPSTKEIFFRWTTFGALSPVMRTHHGTKAKLNWSFDSDEETTAHFARWSQLHARLWPYLKAAAIQSHDTGLPIMRALPLAYPKDQTTYGISNEYLFGPSLLVAPVLVQGAVSRAVYFPADEWLPFDSGTARLGPATATESLPLTEIGLYARAGSILPMLPSRIDTLMPAKAPLVTLADVRNVRSLRVFGGANGSATDLDGTKYSLQSSSHDAVTAVRSSGATLAACAGGNSPCGDIDADKRVVTVRGASLTNVEFVQGASVSTLTTSGGQAVEEVVFRY
jgi:alpha-glucosidase